MRGRGFQISKQRHVSAREINALVTNAPYCAIVASCCINHRCRLLVSYYRLIITMSSGSGCCCQESLWLKGAAGFIFVLIMPLFWSYSIWPLCSNPRNICGQNCHKRTSSGSQWCSKESLWFKGAAVFTFALMISLWSKNCITLWSIQNGGYTHAL